VVECAQKCTVVFNAIDEGELFDVAASSLATALRIPYCTAASYGHSAISEWFSGKQVVFRLMSARNPSGQSLLAVQRATGPVWLYRYPARAVQGTFLAVWHVDGAGAAHEHDCVHSGIYPG
jgi:hypothetical protein